MKTFTMLYAFRYTTAGGAHRYSPRNKRAKLNVGDVYLRGVAEAPRVLAITVEAK